MSKVLEWQQEIIDDEKTTPNGELLDWVIELASGDDYDGCFTKRGSWTFDYLNKKLHERLRHWTEQPTTMRGVRKQW